MRRDMDLVRKILIHLVDHEGKECRIDGVDDQTVVRHMGLMIQAGLLDGDHYQSGDEHSVAINGITWAGHDFLDASRNETVWQKAKTKLAEVGGQTSFAVLVSVLTDISKTALGLRP